VAIVATRDSGGGKTIVATTTQGPVGSTVTTVGPTGPTTVPSSPPAPPPPLPPPAPPNQVVGWPAGTTGYTVVLNSVPTASGGAARAGKFCPLSVRRFSDETTRRRTL